MRDDAAASDKIRLVLPAEPQYGRLARITVSDLALRLGFTYRAIEDLRLAVDETIILLLRPEGRAGTITLVFSVDQAGVGIDATTTAGEDQHWVDQGALAGSRRSSTTRSTPTPSTSRATTSTSSSTTPDALPPKLGICDGRIDGFTMPSFRGGG